MGGELIHKAMLDRCEALMLQDDLPPELLDELDAVSAACAAYEDVVFKIGKPTAKQAADFRADQISPKQKEPFLVPAKKQPE